MEGVGWDKFVVPVIIMALLAIGFNRLFKGNYDQKIAYKDGQKKNYWCGRWTAEQPEEDS